MTEDGKTQTPPGEDIQQENLTDDTANPTPPAGGEFTEQPPEGITVKVSDLLGAMIAAAFFGGGLRKPDGTELTPQELAAAFQQQSSLILNVIGFDDALEAIIPGAGADVNPMYIVGGGVAATVGLAWLMRPPKPKKPKPKMPTTGGKPDEEAEGAPTQ